MVGQQLVHLAARHYVLQAIEELFILQPCSLDYVRCGTSHSPIGVLDKPWNQEGNHVGNPQYDIGCPKVQYVFDKMHHYDSCRVRLYIQDRRSATVLFSIINLIR